MRQALMALGYRSAEIDMINPEIAKVVITRGLERPRQGMPPAWTKDSRTKPGRGAGGLGKLVRALNPFPLVANVVTFPFRVVVGLAKDEGVQDLVKSAAATTVTCAGLWAVKQKFVMVPRRPLPETPDPAANAFGRPMLRMPKLPQLLAGGGDGGDYGDYEEGEAAETASMGGGLFGRGAPSLPAEDEEGVLEMEMETENDFYGFDEGDEDEVDLSLLG